MNKLADQRNERITDLPAGQEGWPFMAVMLLSADTMLSGLVDEGNHYCIVISPGETDLDLTGLYNVLRLQPAVKFSFYFDEGVISKTQLSGLVPFFFLPGSMRSRSRPWVAFSGSSGHPLIIDELQKEMVQHGFGGLEYVVTTRNNNGSTALLFNSVDSFLAEMPDLLNVRAANRRITFIKADDAATVLSASLSIAGIAAGFREAFPIEAALRKDSERGAWQVDFLEKRNGLLENELLNFREYNRILQTRHPDNEIQQFYDREYEILPRWYKKFGHIIKWLMGNRKRNAEARIKNKGVQP